MTSIERVAPAPPSKREVDWIEGLAKRYARSALCPAWAKDNPQKAAVVLFTARSLGIDVTNVAALNNFHEIDGKLEPSAHLYVGLAASHGHELELMEYGPDQAVVEFRRAGSDRWQRITFTIDMARQAGLLDEWAERWNKVDGRNRKETFVLGSGPTPDWAQALIDAGQVKRRDNWHRWPADMLVARAAKRAAKFVAPDAVLGLDRALTEDDPDVGEPPVQQPTLRHEPGPAEPGDDEIEDAELVEDEPARPNPYAKAVHLAAQEAGLSEEALDAILHDHTGSVSANGVTRDNKGPILDAIRKAAKAK